MSTSFFLVTSSHGGFATRQQIRTTLIFWCRFAPFFYISGGLTHATLPIQTAPLGSGITGRRSTSIQLRATSSTPPVRPSVVRPKVRPIPQLSCQRQQNEVKKPILYYCILSNVVPLLFACCQNSVRFDSIWHLSNILRSYQGSKAN